MSYRQLTMAQRYQIEALKKEGLSQRAIALNIGVHYSTICRELRRNALDSGEYFALSAAVSARLCQATFKNDHLRQIKNDNSSTRFFHYAEITILLFHCFC
jgi:IS30 family transposase